MTLLCDGHGLKGPGRCGQGPRVRLEREFLKRPVCLFSSSNRSRSLFSFLSTATRSPISLRDHFTLNSMALLNFFWQFSGTLFSLGEANRRERQVPYFVALVFF
jgi:hypothetical protein